MLKSMLRFSAGLCLVLVSTNSLAASFDCKKATTLVEKAVCANPKLSKLDDALGKAYTQALSRVNDKASLQAEQKDWLAKIRNPCRTEHCIQEVYQIRLAELTADTQPIQSTIFGEYQRYYQGKLDEHTATLNITALGKYKAKITGDSIWIGDAARGNVNLGNIEGEFPISNNMLYYHDEYACKFTVIFKAQSLEVKNDNGRCGGLNVSFNGFYKKLH